MALERDLHELLHVHDLVIVPRFGGFLTHYRPARLDEQRRLIHPPTKDISYNRHLVRTDGLLTDHVAKRSSVGHAQANAVIEGEVDAWLSKLNRTNRLELSRIGTFYRDAEGNLQFDPDRKVNYLKDAFGLRAVAAVPVTRARVKPAVAATAAANEGIPVVQKEPKVITLLPHTEEGARRSALLWAAASVAVVSTLATWWLLNSDPSKGVQVAGFDLFRKKPVASYVHRTTPAEPFTPEEDAGELRLPEGLHGVHTVALPGDEDRTVTVDMGEAPAVEPAASGKEGVDPTVHVAKPDSTFVKTKAVGPRYHIIGGCFLLKDNAEGYVADLRARGFASSIIDQKGGLYRVAIGSYPDRELAEDALHAVREEEAPEAWMLKR